MIYRNDPATKRRLWRRETNPDAPTVARRFLRGETEILRLAKMSTKTIDDLNAFLDITGEMTIEVERAPGGDILVKADKAGESLLITGRTAKVLGAYIDNEPVQTDDRTDMTQRIRAGLSRT